jgi:ferritin-like metal-binding protein YciE
MAHSQPWGQNVVSLLHRRTRTSRRKRVRHLSHKSFHGSADLDGLRARNPFIGAAFQEGNASREKRTGLMGLFTKDIETMDELLLHGLKDIYYAENQIVRSLPKLIEKATNRDLTKGLQDHLQETKNQIGRLDQVFKKLGQDPQGVKCPAIDGLISEADEVAGEVADKDVLDAAIVGSAQAVEHYEIARYGTLIAWAESLGHDDIIRLLNTNLNEEKAADKKLSTVAVRKGVNRKAAS